MLQPMPTPRKSPRRQPARPVPASRGVKSLRPGVRGFDTAADLVHARLAASGLTITELAERSGVERVSLSYWLSGARPLRGDYLLAVLDAVGLKIN